MVGGTFISLNSIGPQDIYLTGNPQITYFKAVYRRHTRFSKEYKRIYSDGGTNINYGNIITYIIPKDGDLLGELFINAKIKMSISSLDGDSYTVGCFGNSLLKTLEFRLGGQRIDYQTAQWLQIYRELYSNFDTDYIPAATTAFGGEDLPRIPDKYIHNRCDGNCALYLDTITNEYTKQMYIPLRFFFNNNIGLSLPLAGLYQQEKKIIIELETKNNLVGDSNITLSDLNTTNFEMVGLFYYLDKSEKNRLINTTQEYLIETLQIHDKELTNTDGSIKTYSLNDLKHPCKYLIWTITNPGTAGSNSGRGPNYFTSLCKSDQVNDDGNGGTFTLYLNGEEKNSKTEMSIFTRYNLRKYCKKMPVKDRIGMYSFSINPLEYEPSGTCNLSKLNNIEVSILPANNTASTVQNKNIYIFAVCYNVLRVNSGMGGLLYS
jgi:hypothetical protein